MQRAQRPGAHQPTRSKARPLSDIRVVSIEQAVAAPLCTRHLLDLGADVIKIERVGSGDFARDYDHAVNGQSTHFVWLNAGKRSVALDLKHRAGVEVLHRLLSTADVLVSNLGPGALDRIVGPRTLTRRYPSLVRCAISGYGPAGPYRDRKAYDLLVQGEAGVTLSTGTLGAPAKAGVSLVDLAAGSYALSAILAALLNRTRTGRGTNLNISMFDAMLEWMTPLLLMQQLTGEVPEPAGMHHATIAPYGAYRTSDGVLINIAVQNDREWRRLCSLVLKAEGLASDPRFHTNERRLRNRPELESTVAAACSRHTADELITTLDTAGIPWGYLNDAAQVLAHPQLLAAKKPREVRMPTGRTVSLPDTALALGPRPRNRQMVPALGAHTLEVLDALGYPTSDVDRLVRTGIVGVGEDAFDGTVEET
ncbi:MULTISPECIES: CaiB/BaiF CoA-transferase family protein [unclassified Mycobacterium]|uniref:CaiB/BaiF CoA transferase family protein n=1 Tax=unclassified Mycobacterium TaxID=2642494 RepID=UPI0029C68267|nr:MULTISPECIES: CaiB/BaiF CoA-transferase family protein [unclassified Mycobacterium]